MSFWGKVFGSTKALDTVVKSARDGLDALVYTDEEKAKDAATDRAEARKMVVEWMASTQGQNLARRVLAFVIGGEWVLMHLLSFLSGAIAIFIGDPDTHTKVMKLQEIAATANRDMNGPVMLILAFYFAAPHMGEFAQCITGKFKKSVNKG